jgi:hypothetical protein
MEKETIEIHNTEYVDRELPTITYDRVITTNKTSKAALETFEKVRKDVK